MGGQCKKVGEVCLDHLGQMKGLSPVDMSSFKTSISELLDMASQLQSNMQRSSESVEDLVESELAAMDKAIEEAAKKIEVRLRALYSYKQSCRLDLCTCIQNLKYLFGSIMLLLYSYLI